MNWSPEKWLAPPHVETPNVVEDVAKYIDSDFTRAMFDGMKDDPRCRLAVLTERLEFIDHLSTLSEILQKDKRVSSCQTPGGSDEIKIVKTYSIVIGGHEFAGFDFDADALVTYLLLTCIDTLKGQPEHVDAFTWLKRRCSGEAPLNWDELKREYERDYGLSTRFKEAFTDDCSQSLKKELAGDFAVVKIASQSIKHESAEAWEKRSESRRVKHIASTLYRIRSSFTHESFRSFSPAVPVRYSLDAKRYVLLQRVGGRQLRTVLTDIVKHLTVKLLIREDQGQPVRVADG